jgi:hypothetical protein
MLGGGEDVKGPGILLPWSPSPLCLDFVPGVKNLARGLFFRRCLHRHRTTETPSPTDRWMTNRFAVHVSHPASHVHAQTYGHALLSISATSCPSREFAVSPPPDRGHNPLDPRYIMPSRPVFGISITILHEQKNQMSIPGKSRWTEPCV